MMADSKERIGVQTFLEGKYGPDLIPSESELEFPSDPAVGDLVSWQPAFDRLKALYGKDVGTNRRMGKDLRKYETQEVLLRQSLRFSNLDVSRFRVESGLELVLHLQDFPREHLYRVESNGITILEFDDWPSDWFRDWEN